MALPLRAARQKPRISADEGTIVRVKGVPETIYSKIKDHEGVKACI